MTDGNDQVLSVRSLSTEFDGEDGALRVVDDVAFSVGRGEILGIVGESGSGKSVTGYSIMGLVDPPGRVASGDVVLEGRRLDLTDDAAMRKVRGNAISMIFQDPMTSLHPLLTIGDQMIDAILAHRKMPKREARSLAVEALRKVGIPSPEVRVRSYPHQLSGGMRQRVAIAIASLNQPALIIADEPTTGLDVTIQAQILHEIQMLVADRGMAVIWITHDMAVVGQLADRVAVMYAGRIVEEGPTQAILDSPAHPYTIGLLGSLLGRNRGKAELPQIPGSIDNAHRLTGCRFAPRCAHARAECEARPPMVEVSPGHHSACILATEQADG
ncbi:MAG TPA: ABC transporter ATP-binding protein [Aquamicrobium sp.]|nr:ABC transporter ATP-binding protein [Aquamicrobium sp.]